MLVTAKRNLWASIREQSGLSSIVPIYWITLLVHGAIFWHLLFPLLSPSRVSQSCMHYFWTKQPKWFASFSDNVEAVLYYVCNRFKRLFEPFFKHIVDGLTQLSLTQTPKISPPTRSLSSLFRVLAPALCRRLPALTLVALLAVRLHVRLRLEIELG